MLATANTGKTQEGFGKKMHMNESMTRRVEVSKDEIPGSKRSMCGYILTYSVFSEDGTLICASASSYCGNLGKQKKTKNPDLENEKKKERLLLSSSAALLTSSPIPPPPLYSCRAREISSLCCIEAEKNFSYFS